MYDRQSVRCVKRMKTMKKRNQNLGYHSEWWKWMFQITCLAFCNLAWQPQSCSIRCWGDCCFNKWDSSLMWEWWRRKKERMPLGEEPVKTPPPAKVSDWEDSALCLNVYRRKNSAVQQQCCLYEWLLSLSYLNWPLYGLTNTYLLYVACRHPFVHLQCELMWAAYSANKHVQCVVRWKLKPWGQWGFSTVTIAFESVLTVQVHPPGSDEPRSCLKEGASSWMLELPLSGCSIFRGFGQDQQFQRGGM